MILVPENTLERLQQRQKILTPPVTQTLKSLDSQMNDILSSKELDDEAKATLYNQVLQRYLTYYDQRKGQPLHVKLTTPKPVSMLISLPLHQTKSSFHSVAVKWQVTIDATIMVSKNFPITAEHVGIIFMTQ